MSVEMQADCSLLMASFVRRARLTDFSAVGSLCLSTPYPLKTVLGAADDMPFLTDLHV